MIISRRSAVRSSNPWRSKPDTAGAVVRFAALTVLIAGCGGAPLAVDNTPSANEKAAVSAEDFARTAFSAIDAAQTCGELQTILAQFLEPSQPVEDNPLVRCVEPRRGVPHRISTFEQYDPGMWLEDPEPEVLTDADSVLLITMADREQISMDVPMDGWMVLTGGRDHRLFNVGIHLLKDCLRTRTFCRVTG